MKHIISSILVFVVFVGQLTAQTDKQKKELEQFASFLKTEEIINFKKALKLASIKGWPLQFAMQGGGVAKLTGVSFNGLPEYTATDNNVGAAHTTGASSLWNGGSTGLNLTGSSPSLNGKIAIWDGGAVLGSHQELNGRIVAGDGAASLSDHATHVTGTIMAKGINPAAKGMMYNLNDIKIFDFATTANAEIAANANNLILSNHSYGTVAGWRRNNNNIWEWYGPWGATEDYQFGYYSQTARYWDSVAALSPNYLIVKSAGNNRDQNGPNTGQVYRRLDAGNMMTDMGAYMGDLSRNDSYDVIPTYGNAKNVLTVAAVGILNNGFSNPDGVQMSSFSSWGPTDDGRIKPDISAAGVDLLSSIATGTNAYDIYSGTSMSSPNATGSLGLLQELYQRETSSFMKSATLKALAIHTADESGTSLGPDYQFGFGLLNVKKGSEVIIGRNTKHRIQELNLNQAALYSANHISIGGEKLTATIVWTDPAATVETVNYLNNRTKKLVNDLDIRVVSSSGTEMPWKLDVNNPANPATKGDNDIDNVEKIEIVNPIPGQSYEVRVTNKGSLLGGAQNFSLILSGVGGVAYCASGPTSSSDTRIDLFNFGGISKTNTGCTQYTNATNLFASGFPGQVLPFTLTLGSCGVNNNKIAKIFIDWNIDGDFEDIGETAAVSGVVSGIGSFSGNISIPNTISVGASTRIRIVVSETTDATMVTPCGSYAKGETMDLSFKFTGAPVDAKTLSIALPESGSCASDYTFVSATFQNAGTQTLATIPARAVILDGNSVVATLLDTVKTATAPNGFANLIFKPTFVSLPGKTYTIKVNTDVVGEIIRNNDTSSTTRTISSGVAGTGSNSSAQICSANQAALTTNTSAGVAYWYTAATGGQPIATGNQTTTSIVPANRTYYLGINDAKGSIGAVNKNSLSSTGNYAQFSNYQTFVVYSPTVIENLRMYFGHPGTITIQVKEAGSGNVVASKSFDVEATSSTITAPPAQGPNDLNDQGVVLPVDLIIPTAGSYTMNCLFSNNVTAFRNNSIATNPYPSSVPNLIAMTGNNNGNTTYYWFYDLKVRALGCVNSNARVAVVADAALNPVISQNGPTLTVSEMGSTYQWTKDGLPVANSNSQSITLTASGAYVCTVFKGGCSYNSASFNAVFTAITNVSPVDVNFKVAPNPVKGKAYVSFTLPSKETVTIDILTTDGKIIKSFQTVALSTTLVNKQIDLEQFAVGSYFLRLSYDNKQVLKQIQIQ